MPYGNIAFRQIFQVAARKHIEQKKLRLTVCRKNAEFSAFIRPKRATLRTPSIIYLRSRCEIERKRVIIVDKRVAEFVVAFNGLKKGTITGKGVINNKMSNLMMQMLEKKGIPTHFAEQLNQNSLRV